MQINPDVIYTPREMAIAMVNTIGVNHLEISRVADFAVGNGALLQAAEDRWPLATFIGTDIDYAAVEYLKSNKSHWHMGRCDFINPHSRGMSLPIRGMKGKINLVLLNPPFSCRGGVKIPASINGVKILCSTGMAFVLNSVDYLCENGIIIALLPVGSLTSEKDAMTWQLLEKLGTVNITMQNNHNIFPQHEVHTLVLHFVKGGVDYKSKTRFMIQNQQSTHKFNKPSLLLMRGNLQMNELQESVNSDGCPLIHSTELLKTGLSFHRRVNNKTLRIVNKSAVLIPRVGKPTMDKIVCYTGDNIFALSDCVIAMICGDRIQARSLWENLRNNWTILKDAYVGSASKYITLRRLTNALNSLGYPVRYLNGQDQ